MFVSIISACSAVSKEVEKDSVVEKKPSLAIIYGFDVKKEALWFLVKSNGCTKENNFTLTSKTVDNKTTEFSLLRSKRDLCRGLPKIISITMPINNADTDDNHYVIANPISPKPERIKR